MNKVPKTLKPFEMSFRVNMTKAPSDFVTAMKDRRGESFQYKDVEFCVPQGNVLAVLGWNKYAKFNGAVLPQALRGLTFDSCSLTGRFDVSKKKELRVRHSGRWEEGKFNMHVDISTWLKKNELSKHEVYICVQGRQVTAKDFPSMKAAFNKALNGQKM